jgi:hypothetical protein
MGIEMPCASGNFFYVDPEGVCENFQYIRPLQGWDSR